MKEYLTIGEMAEIFHMDVQLLRHYDAKGLLVPSRRNAANGRRFYYFDQVYPLATIRYLRKLGYSLDKINKFLYADDVNKNVDTLVEQTVILRRRCEELMDTINIIQKKLDFIEAESQFTQKDSFRIKTYPQRQFIHIGDELNLFTHELFYFYPTVGFYQGEKKWFGAYLFDELFDGEAAGPALSQGAEQAVIPAVIPGGRYLCGYHYGPYHKIQESIDKLYAAGREYELEECVVTLNIIDQFVEGHPANYITALEVLIKE